MAPFLIYASAGIVAGYLVLVRLEFFIWAGHVRPLDFLTALASLTLILGGILSLFKPRTGMRIAFWASIMSTLYFGPVFAANVFNSFAHGCSYPLKVYVAPGLLVLSLVHSAAGLRHAEKTPWLFPKSAARRKYLAIPISLLLLATTPYSVHSGLTLVDPFVLRRVVRKELTWKRGDLLLGPQYVRLEFSRGRFTCGHEVSNTPGFADYIESLARPVIHAEYEVFYKPNGEPQTAGLLTIEDWGQDRLHTNDALFFGSSKTFNMSVPGDCFEPLDQ